MTKIISGINEIIHLYDFFILDQWGVMHDGKYGYDHAIKSVDKLIKENKKLIIISNSSKRRSNSISKLKFLGFDKNNFIEVMTSGEMIWQELFNSIKNYGVNLKNCFHIYNDSVSDSLDFIKDLDGFNFVNNIEKSDFILACTPFKNTLPIDYIPILTHALKLDLIMFCANPDFITIEYNKNEANYLIGTIAEMYKYMGGKVIILGKPSKKIYLESCKIIKDEDLSKIVAIGDSLDHDIKGAINFGIDSVLISSGVHKDLFGENLQKGLNNIANNNNYDFNPTYLCRNFSL